MKFEIIETYSQERIENMKSVLLGIILATPAVVLTTVEILMQTL